MTRLHGRCALGQRLVARVPHNHRETLAFVAGLRCDGIIAPCVFDQPINAVSFLAWVTKFLMPMLRRGDVVVMDNLSSHKAAAIRRAIRSAGASLIILPPYSPNLNPIEQLFSMLKKLLATRRTSNAIAMASVLPIPSCASAVTRVARASLCAGSRALPPVFLHRLVYMSQYDMYQVISATYDPCSADPAGWCKPRREPAC